MRYRRLAAEIRVYTEETKEKTGLGTAKKIIAAELQQEESE